MARSWLEVTTDEVQSKLGSNQRLAERRDSMAARAQAVVEQVAAPVFEAAAEARGWVYREVHNTEWSVVCCGIHAPGEVERDPTVAFCMAEFDAYQPLVVLRRKADGAAAEPVSRIVMLGDLDEAALKTFLAEDTD
ncbi:hypothetical protein [Salinisphaera sp. T31B1]|uniref:hypothetical protein n=1 Tax=Salinisphaera sp. T31B1 TaxID=727963 RepID=UPI00333FACDD